MDEVVRDTIAHEAEEFARRWGIRDVPRLERILRQTAIDAFGRRIPSEVDPVDPLGHGLTYYPHVVEAFEAIPSDLAIRVFEDAGPELLTRRLRAFNHLASGRTLFYTHRELAEALSLFGAHLEKNRESLIAIGYPRTSLEDLEALVARWGALYPVKLPVRVGGTIQDTLCQVIAEAVQRKDLSSPEADEDGERVYTYTWSSVPCPPWGFVEVSGQFYTQPLRDDDEPIPLCSYEEAASIEGLSPALARWLGHSREKLFALRRQIVDVLIAALRARRGDSVWQAAWSIVSTELSGENVAQLLQADSLYAQWASYQAVQPPYRCEMIAHPGGLTELLALIGHVEKELEIGSYEKTKQLLLTDLPEFGELASYYAVVGRAEQRTVDRALDGFLELEASEAGFWSRFERRLTALLRQRLQEGGRASPTVALPDAAVLRGILGTSADAHRQHLKWTLHKARLAGREPVARPFSGASFGAEQQNIFRKDGDKWTVCFEGLTKFVSDIKGMRAIAYLLARPGQEVPALLLARVVEGAVCLADGAHAAGKWLQEMNTDAFRSADEVLSASEMRDLKRRLSQQEKQRQEAEVRGDGGKAAELDPGIAAIKQALERDRDHRGRSRPFADESEKARKAVSSIIRRARDHIKGCHPGLGRHLQSHLRLGKQCVYVGSSDLLWITE